MSILIRGE